MTATMTTADAIREFVAAVFDHDDLIEVRAIHGDGRNRVVEQWWLHARELGLHADELHGFNHRNFNIYCGVNPRKHKGVPGVSAKQCAEARPCGACNTCVTLARNLFADFDNATVEQVRIIMADKCLPEPTLLVQSGHGVHSYWRLESAMSDLFAWRCRQQALIDLLHSDEKVHDPARILRMPGFMNCKRLPHIPCEIVSCNPDAQYQLADFPELKQTAAPTVKRAAGPVKAKDRQLAIEALSRLNPARADDYGHWIATGMAMHFVDCGDDMLAAWDKWSRSSDKYQSDDCRLKWLTFNGKHNGTRGAVTLGTLTKMVREDEGNASFNAPRASLNGHATTTPRDPKSSTQVAEAANDAPHPITDESAAPLTLDYIRVRPMPDGIFTGWLHDMIEATAAATETPRELAAALALGVVSMAVQKTFSVRPESGYFEQLSLWMVPTLDSGERKSAVMAAITAPLIHWEHRRAEDAQQEIKRIKSERKTMEERIKHLRDKAAKSPAGAFTQLQNEITDLEMALPDIPVLPRLVSADVTVEHLGTMMSQHGERMALISDEGGLFELLAGRYSNGVPNLDLFLKAYTGSFVRVDRGSRPAVALNHPALAIAISPQPDVLRGLTKAKQFRGRGLLARFLPLLPQSKLGFRNHTSRPVPDLIAAQYEACIFRLLETSPAQADGDDPHSQPHPRAILLDSEAHQIWKAQQRAIEIEMREGGRFENLHDWAGKLPGTIARLAGCLHCAEWALEKPDAHAISADTMQRAITLADFLADHAIAAFDLMGADTGMDAARKAWAWIEKNKRTAFTVRELWKGKRGTFPKVADLEPALAVLTDTGHITLRTDPDSPSPGRPSRIFRVNPLLTEGWPDAH